MAKTYPYQPTQRDLDILSAIALLPLTPAQLLKFSQTFQQPFTQIDDVRRRLRKLGTKGVGFIRSFPLSVPCHGSSPRYHRLTPDGFRLLHGEDDQKRCKRTCSPIGIARHIHSVALTEFIIHTAVTAKRTGVTFRNAYAENEYVISEGEETLRLDGRFTLATGDVSRTYNVELDNSTESILSARDGDSIERKLKRLERFDSRFDARHPDRAITLFVTTRSWDRLEHILDAAVTLLRNPDRSLIYGVHLPDFLLTETPLTSEVFLNQRRKPVALLPSVIPTSGPFPSRTLSKVASR